MNPNEKDREDTLLYAAIQFNICKRKKSSDEELQADLPNQLFSSLKAKKKDITLNLKYPTFEKRCFIRNRILVTEKYFI